MTDVERIADILQRIYRIERATAGGRAAYFESEVVQDAVIRNLEVIGEAAKNVGSATRKRFPRVDWKGMGRFRDLAIHHDGHVLAEEVWRVVEDDLPRLKRELGRKK
jgi:uncharacterized protein with HEPN domain